MKVKPLFSTTINASVLEEFGIRYTPFNLTHWSSEGRKVSHCYRSRCCYGEPTCNARVVKFEVVADAAQPRFHHIQHPNEVTVGPGCSVGHQ